MIGSAAKAKLLVFATFLVGALTGALIQNAYETRSNSDEVSNEKISQSVIKDFYAQLNLTPEQRQQWTKVMEESKPEFDKLAAENRRLTEPTQAKFEELRERTRSKVRAILTENQRKQYDENNAKRRQRQFRQARPK